MKCIQMGRNLCITTEPSLSLYLSPPLSESVVLKLHNFTIQRPSFKSVNMTHCIILYNAAKPKNNSAQAHANASLMAITN